MRHENPPPLSHPSELSQVRTEIQQPLYQPSELSQVRTEIQQPLYQPSEQSHQNNETEPAAIINNEGITSHDSPVPPSERGTTTINKTDEDKIAVLVAKLEKLEK